MSSSLYTRFIRLCKSWPLDKTKTTRDFGAHLHKQLIVWFPKGQLTQIQNLNELDKQISSLERLNNDTYKRKYSDQRVAKLKPSSLFTKEEIKHALSTKYIKENQEMQKVSTRIKHGIKDFKIDLNFIKAKKNDKKIKK